MQEQIALGIDIGGTNTAFGLVTKTGELLFEASVPTNDYLNPEDLVRYIYAALSDKLNHYELLGIGIGAPNGNVFTGKIEFAPNLIWEGVVPIVDLFEKHFGVFAVCANDANAAALGEHLFGCATELTDFVTITLGTGLGSGVFINGQLVLGKHGFAGEYGHIRVINNGRLCGCGRNGCLETYVSSTGVVRSISELSSSHKSQSSLIKIENPTALDVFEAAKKNDAFAQEIIEFTAEILGSALADFAAFSNPEAYVLFGGIAQSGDDFSNRVKYYLEKNTLKIYQNQISLVVSTLHDKNAAILGTAATVFWKNKQLHSL